MNRSPRGIILSLLAILSLTACASNDKSIVPKEPLPHFSFGVIADVQYCDQESRGVRHYRASLAKLEECVEDLNTRDLAFTIHLGDFIDKGVESFKKALPLYERLEMPAYHVLGNHDFDVPADRKGDVCRILGLEERYYDFHVQGWRFIVLDGNDVSLYARPEDSGKHREAAAMLKGLKDKKAAFAQAWNGGVGSEQMAWLENALKEAEDEGDRVVVFCHFPVYPDNAHNLWNSEEVVRLLESFSCVKAYINGHNHAGNYGKLENIHYVTLPGMVDTPDTNAYGWVDVFEDRLELNGRGRTTSRTLLIR